MPILRLLCQWASYRKSLPGSSNRPRPFTIWGVAVAVGGTIR